MTDYINYLNQTKSQMLNFFNGAISAINRINPFKPKTVFENLIANHPQMNFIDRTNDGFTTHDVLNGAYQDKLFGPQALYPHHFFQPLETAEIDIADSIILSLGGNNFVDYFQDIINQKDEYSSYATIFKTMIEEYKQILSQLLERNPSSHIILMTQYYPAFFQKFFSHDAYDFMYELGKQFNLEGAVDVIVKIMEDSYEEIIQFITTDETMSQARFSIVDVTSSFNPTFSYKYESQIGLSEEGSSRIAQILGYVLKQPNQDKNKIYRFLPYFFSNEESQFVKEAILTKDFKLHLVHPNKMTLSNQTTETSWKPFGIVCFSALSALIAGRYDVILASYVLFKVSKYFNNYGEKIYDEDVFNFNTKPKNYLPSSLPRQPQIESIKTNDNVLLESNLTNSGQLINRKSSATL